MPDNLDLGTMSLIDLNIARQEGKLTTKEYEDAVREHARNAHLTAFIKGEIGEADLDEALDPLR
jgi:hypothetical protein